MSNLVRRVMALAILVSGLSAAGAASDSPATSSATNAAGRATGFAAQAGLREDVVERQYRSLLAADDAAQEEIDRWIRDADARPESVDQNQLAQRIQERIAGIDRAYQDFLTSHPKHVDARVAYGSFLTDTGREMLGREQWEHARVLAPENPAIYANLASTYGHRGPVTNAFICFEKAIELDPKEPTYYQSFATAVFLFRKDVMEHYRITDEQRVFDKALALYAKAQELDPTNFILATDIAQTFYGIRPPRHDEARAAWMRAMNLASDDLERQGIHVHLARVEVQAGRFDAARAHLELVQDPQYAHVKGLVVRTLERRVAEAGAPAATNATTEASSGTAR